MTPHLVAHQGERGRGTENRLVRLAWSDFWLLAGILGGILALVALVFLEYLAAR